MATKKNEAPAPTATVDTQAVVSESEAAKQKEREDRQAERRALAEESAKADLMLRRQVQADIDTILRESGCALTVTDLDVRNGQVVGAAFAVVRAR
jgi:hypothetical protein